VATTAIVVAAVAAATAMAPANASASNRCTRYVGSPGGVFNSSSCPPLTSWGTVSLGGALWSQTGSTGLRDENFIDLQGTVCSDHLHLRYSNGQGNTASWGCVGAWIWGGGSGGYAESWCGVHHSGDTSGIASYGQCYTKWTV
jgi:hypothetical protein